MEFTLDLALVRQILKQERAQMRGELRDIGVFPAFQKSQHRHDVRIAAAADIGSLACREGCTWCCYFTVDVRAAEVFIILDHIDAALTPSEQNRIYAEIRANSRLLRSLGENERVTRNLKCPLLNDGRCAVYSARPQSCRNYHATSAAGCQQSFEQPENLDIDPDFAPGVYQSGGAHTEAVSEAMREARFDVDAYELNCALEAALSDPGARTRFASGQRPFKDLTGQVVETQFEDLYP